MTPFVETITCDEGTIAIIVRANYDADGIHFFTSPDFSQQLAYMKRPKEYIIPPHVHNPVHRDVTATQEVLFIKKGKLRVDFYDTQRVYQESRVLEAGDVILLITGGHGFEALEEIEMFEVKQGPYVGDQDKTRFVGIAEKELNVKT